MRKNQKKITCKNCKKDFICGSKAKRKFCCWDCFITYHNSLDNPVFNKSTRTKISNSKKNKGLANSNPNWIGGAAPWIKQEARKAVLKSGRRIDKCECCKEIKEQKDVDMHHKDKNRKNNKSSNIAVLCSKCHGRLHGKENVIKLKRNAKGRFKNQEKKE